MAAALAEYRVEAYNTAHDSENKIHDDSVAQRFGFTGGLVPGVDVYAYMTQAPVGLWELDWLTHGTAGCRFTMPVYDGAEAIVTGKPADPDERRLVIGVASGGHDCASGWAALDEDRMPAPSVEEIARAPLPADRPPASAATLATGRTLGTYETIYAATTAQAYLRDTRECHPVYETEGVAHPGFILRMANWALTHNVVLGPWIHVGSTVQHFGLARIGDRLTARARVTGNYEKKGHRFVDLDVIVAADDVRAVARIAHTAIYEPRQSRD
jgi:hypothetical protein